MPVALNSSRHNDSLEAVNSLGNRARSMPFVAAPAFPFFLGISLAEVVALFEFTVNECISVSK